MLLFKSGIKGRIPQVGTSYHNKKISCSQLCWSRSFSIKPDFQNELDEKYFKYPQIEKEIYNWWDSKGFFKPLESSNLDSKIKRFVLPMPPPNVTGYLHMGHAIFLALQDIMVRFHRMKGYSTLWIPGTDHAGIATQLLVERKLAAEGVHRMALSREEFISCVWKWKEEKGGYITQQMKRLGASADWTKERFTLEPSMNEAVTEAFLRLHDQGLIYKANYMVNWSPNLQTAVSDLEVDYVEEKGKLFYFKYVLAEDLDTFIPVATTRPETILGDTAVCVHPNDPRYAKYIGKEVLVPIAHRRIPVIADEYVDMKFGTGALKITPAHDANDYELAKKHNLLMINVMNRDATINEIGGSRYAGLDRFLCREILWNDMKESNLAIKEEMHVQRIPRSQRGGEIIEPMISPQWFLKMNGMAEKAIEVVRNGDLKIIPERFEKVWYNWLENIHDWCISRQLWWGHRIPVYYVENSPVTGSEQPYIVARSEAEAYALAREKYGSEVQLKQDEDVLDTWFSSGLWPFSILGWPSEEHKTISDLNRFYPGDVLETGYDILFFWVARMVTMGLQLTGKAPFKVVYLHGLVRDGHGQKMSKTKGNVIDPIETIEQYGADALRYSLVTGSTPGQDVPLSLERVESNRNFVNKLWNIGKYMQSSLKCLHVEDLMVTRNLEARDVEHYGLPERFIIAKAHKLVQKVSTDLESFRFGEAGRHIYDFLWDDMADWYVEASKSHIKHHNDEDVQKGALKTLVYVWDICLRLLHPFMPYITETLWQNIPHKGESLMIAPWPSFNGDHNNLFVDQNAIRAFEKFQKVIISIRNVRAEYNVDPSRKISAIFVANQSFANEIHAELNMLLMMARLDGLNVHIVNSNEGHDAKLLHADKGPFVHLVVDDGVEVLLPQSGLLDKEKERSRLSKQVQKLEKDINVLQERLSNRNYVDKAPSNVIKDSQNKLREMEQQLVVIQNSLKSLS